MTKWKEGAYGVRERGMDGKRGKRAFMAEREREREREGGSEVEKGRKGG